MAEKTKSLFEKFYNASDEARKEMKKPLEKRRIKRKFQSAYDDAENKKLEAEERLQKARQNFDNFNVNDNLRAKLDLDRAIEVQKALEEEYEAYFGETMA